MADGLPSVWSLRAKLLSGGLPCLAAEAFAVVVPLHALVPLTPEARSLALTTAGVAVALAVVVQALFMRHWLRPVDQMLRLKATGDQIPTALGDAAYAAILRVPLRAVWLRGAQWALGALAVAVVVARAGALPRASLLTVLVVGVVHPLGLEVFRAAWLSRVLLRLRVDLLPNIEPWRLFRDSYGGRLLRGGLITGIIGGVGVGTFVWLFVWMTLEQYRVLQTYFPLTVLPLVLGAYAVLRRLRRPIDAYLTAVSSSETGPAPQGEDEALDAYRAAQSLPYRLGLLTIAVWIVAFALLCLEAVLLFDIDFETVALIAGTGSFGAIGVALSEALSHRAVLRPLLTHLAARHRLAIEDVASPMTLRAKMLWAFLGLTVFACGLSFFWSFVEYKRLATEFIKKESYLKLDWVVSDITRQAHARHTGPGLTAIDHTLRAVATQEDGAHVYFIPEGRIQETIGWAPGLRPAPPLPRLVRVRFLRHAHGSLEVNELGLTGGFRTLTHGDRSIGKLVVLYPGYHRRGPGILGSLRAPIVFFLLLFALSAMVVLRVVREITTPIRALEARASEMAKGELGRPVYGIGEADELGRLTYAFEEMRRELNRKLRSTESLTIDLEREVLRRTEDLERSNRELRNALTRLRRAQAELVRSEKMASIGQLIAGIAHEINNPVNAIANTVTPLEETVTAAMAAAGPEQQAAVEDLSAMVRVIQRGAHRTKEIVRALHNYARGDDDRLTDVDLHRGLDDSLDLLRHHLRGLEIERAYGEVARVRGFAGQLHQVFMNLLANAAQAMHLSGKGGHIRISTQRRGHAAVITITDDGPGIPEEVLPRIFDPFFTTKDVGDGSGLGLSIVHGIVDRHGGSINVASEVGKGTTFTVILPLEGPAATASPGDA